MALETSAEAPAPLRQVAGLVGGWIGRLGGVWVEAEVAQLNRRPGICFLTLRDLEATISVSATCHSSVLDSSPTPIIEGTRVVAHAKPDYYEPTGRFALALREIRPAGEGELLAQMERRKQLLAAEGLFDPRRKKPLPLLPRGIGLVTGRDSAAERDVLENIRLRWPAANVSVVHSLMQGPQCAAQVISSVQQFDADDSIDVIIVARGGGSMEDLLPFSDEALVRAVAAVETPVVSAIGHEPDVPLLDLVADLRASTPTDAAKRVVPDVSEEMRGLTQATERLRRSVLTFVERERHLLQQIRSRPALSAPESLIDIQAELVGQQRERLHRATTNRLDRASDEVGHHLARVRALSPLATLERGYSVTLNAKGETLTSVAGLEAKDKLTIHLTDGAVSAVVTDIEETNRG